MMIHRLYFCLALFGLTLPLTVPLGAAAQASESRVEIEVGGTGMRRTVIRRRVAHERHQLLRCAERAFRQDPRPTAWGFRISADPVRTTVLRRSREAPDLERCLVWVLTRAFAREPRLDEPVRVQLRFQPGADVAEQASPSELDVARRAAAQARSAARCLREAASRVDYLRRQMEGATGPRRGRLGELLEEAMGRLGMCWAMTAPCAEAGLEGVHPAVSAEP